LYIFDVLEMSVSNLAKVYVQILKVIVKVDVVIEYGDCDFQYVYVRANWISPIRIQGRDEQLVEEFSKTMLKTPHNKF
jgi:hypothetical protein